MNSLNHWNNLKRFFKTWGLLKAMSEALKINSKRGDKVFTLDRPEGYSVTKPHLTISRVLQGYESVLLADAVNCASELRYFPVSLDSDGFSVLIRDEDYTSTEDAIAKLEKCTEATSLFFLGRRMRWSAKLEWHSKSGNGAG